MSDRTVSTWLVHLLYSTTFFSFFRFFRFLHARSFLTADFYHMCFFRFSKKKLQTTKRYFRASYASSTFPEAMDSKKLQTRFSRFFCFFRFSQGLLDKQTPKTAKNVPEYLALLPLFVGPSGKKLKKEEIETKT